MENHKSQYRLYNQLKSFTRKILPLQVLHHIEPTLRGLLIPFYWGRRYQCSICLTKLRKFESTNADESLCPICGSLPRHRRLWMLLKQDYLRNEMKVLDFSPARCLYRKMKREANISYVATDISADFISDMRLNITDIALETESLDLIICYHVLEHVEEDTRALMEIYRVLKKGGKCIIQTPFEKTFLVNKKIVKKTDRLKFFGQVDHVRVYSVEILQQRMESAGLQVQALNYQEHKDNYFGFKTKETILVVTKAEG